MNNTHTMKKLILFIFINLSLIGLKAQTIIYEDAKQIAINFFNSIDGKDVTLKSASNAQVDSFKTFYANRKNLKSTILEPTPAFYIYNRSDKTGFVIVSGDERIRKIIAYSRINRIENINPSLEALLFQYVLEIEEVKRNNLKSANQINEFSTIEVGPILSNEIQWDQAPEPYNASCPYDVNSKYSNNRVPVGCSATVLAQIMYYYKYPRNGVGSHSYNSDYGVLSADFQNTTYQYELMLGKPAQEQNLAIATLCYHAGISEDMAYGPDGSGTPTSKLEDALENYFQYKDATLLDKSFYSWSIWENKIKNEIDNDRPVAYRGFDPVQWWNPFDGGGHIFIIDGYNDVNQFWVNWGWGGSANGWYALTNLLSFENNHKMIIGIEPANPDISSPYLTDKSFTSKINTEIELEFNEPVDIKSLINGIIFQGSKNGIYNLSQPIYKSDNNTKTVLIAPTQDYYNNEVITVTLTQNITDLVGNNFDGDKNGTPGPSYTFSFQTEGYEHDYSVESIDFSNATPMVNDIVGITTTIKNNGSETESAIPGGLVITQNGNPSKEFDIPSLSSGQEHSRTFYWSAVEGLNNFVATINLPNDQNQDNDKKSNSVYVVTQGNLLIDGELNTEKNISLSQASDGTYSLQLQNTGTGDILVVPEATGTQRSWISLTDGTPVALSKSETKTYNFKVTIPSGTSTGTYQAGINFKYDGGQKISVVTLNIKVSSFENGLITYDLNAGEKLIDGGLDDDITLRYKFDNTYYFDIDNEPNTIYQDEVSVERTFEPNEYDRINKAYWHFNQLTRRNGNASIKLENLESGAFRRISSSYVNPQWDIIEWINKGLNTFEIGLTNYTIDGGGEQWYVALSDIIIELSNAAWATDKGPNQSDIEKLGVGYDYIRIYFDVENVYTEGNLILFNNGEEIDDVRIGDYNEGDTKYFNLYISEIESENYFNIKGDSDDDTKVNISNIRFEARYFEGDPNLRCMKSLSSTKVSLNENVTVNLNFENIGSNIADEPRFNDSPLPVGMELVSGSLSGDPGDVDPGETQTVSYIIQASTPGTYTFGANAISYEDPSGHEYSTQFNAVTLTVNGGSLLVNGQLNNSEIIVGEEIIVSAIVNESVSNSNVTDAVVTCLVENTTTNTTFGPFYLVYNNTLKAYTGTFDQTDEEGAYEIILEAQKLNYETGNLTNPLICNVLPEPYLTVTPTEANVDNTAGNFTFVVNSNVSWSASEEEEWIDIIEYVDEGFTLYYKENTGISFRTGNIVVTSEKAPNRMVFLTQEASPVIDYSISGMLFYDNSVISPLSDITIDLLNSSQSSIAQCITNSNGNYSLQNINTGQYTLAPNIDLAWEGVNVLDVLKIMKSIAGENITPPFNQLASDVDGDGNINVQDVLRLKYKLGDPNNYALPHGDWYYENTDVSIISSDVTQDITTYCYGDVDGSNTTLSTKSANEIFKKGTNYIEFDNDEVRVPFKVNRTLENLSAIGLTFTYPDNIFDVTNIQMASSNEDLHYTAIEGTIRIVFATLNSFNISKEENLFTVSFKLKNNIQFEDLSKDELTFSGTGTFGVYNTNILNDIELFYPTLSIKSVVQEITYNQIKVFPNPAKEMIYIKNAENTTISIYNLLGYRLKSEECNSDIHSIDISDLTPGSYLIKINFNTESVTKYYKIIIQP